MKRLFQVSVGLLWLALGIIACQKEALLPPPAGTEISPGQPHRNVLNTGQLASARSHSGDGLRTQLGAQRENPYTTTRVAAAHRSLYGSQITEMDPTHFYVQFTPQSLDDIRRLEATDETFYDFPLDYEVIQLGEYYQELGPEDFPIWYAVVPAGFDYPEVDHQVLADLYLDQSDPLLIAESFRLTGQADLIHSDIPGATGQRPEDLPDDGPNAIPNPPDCPPATPPTSRSTTAPFPYAGFMSVSNFPTMRVRPMPVAVRGTAVSASRPAV